MEIKSYIVLFSIIAMIFALIKDFMRPGLVLFSTAVLFMVIGVITPNELVAGFSNKGMLTIAALYLVSEGIRHSGMLNNLAAKILPSEKKNKSRMLLTIMLPISAISAFINNTPIVIIFAPIIKNWAERLNLSASKFLIPLSYATIFGGICTLIGTSTNLVVNGMMQEAGFTELGMFELGKIGFIIALVGWLYIAFVGHYLLPGDKKNKNTDEVKQYYFNLLVTENSRYIGETVYKRQLGNNKNITIAGLERNGEMIDTQNKQLALLEGDKLLVSSIQDNISNALSHDGFEIITQGDLKQTLKSDNLHQIEVVLAPRFPGIGCTLSEFDFYNRYKGIVLAIHRNGEDIVSNLAEERLRSGDSLVILADKEFVESWQDSRIFFLISSKGEVTKPVKTFRVKGTIAIVSLMVLGASLGKYYLPSINGSAPDMFFFATVAAVLMGILGIFPPKKYARAIGWDVLITIASAFAISKALINSEVAQMIAHTAINSVKHMGPVAVLAIIYLVTTVFTELITNNAAAAIAFPIALSAATQLGVDPKPFFIAICIAASASFASPIGYQTNMIVQSISNYKFKDFLKVGLPLNLLAFIFSVIFIPMIWEF